MGRTWKKLTLRLKQEEDKEKLYVWFMDKNPLGFWEKDHLMMVVYLDHWPEAPFPDYIVDFIKEEEPDENWAEEWRKNFKPISINDFITVRPPWEKSSSTPIDIVIYPAYAFGTGDHATTAVCMQFIARYLIPGMSFLDVGMGSGILSLLAVRLGAGEITAIDIDLLAMEELERNCILNQIDLTRIHFRVGNLTAVSGNFDFIVANIGAQFQLENLPTMSDLLTLSGFMVLSGFQTDDAPSIQKRTESFPLRLIESQTRQDWVTQVYQKQ